ncbi:peptidyl-tRNA hydrolase ICT1, mitochondrial-like [Centruroides sculpturatus]|uniref:peptidyl-tRNA hydrolase ICT1, mitochondrial-like n=1 Tax=Centruroides sculpturatus TaxID=218467 RepID=UPI000C6DC2FA|nr:peptidyl-tRNA hydrolase ICT1, mitochondrial-like [Centruroides sculpturatus]XP_023238687.1 peptidyl-tRNA hydrolase ICT1, mitochondrial-like [Centruroides sculpturatus]
MASMFGRFVFNANLRKSVDFRRFSSFKSNYSLDKIYPNSNLNISTAQEIPKNEGEKFSGYIPLEDIQITHSRSSGPGGQNVNKVNSKVEVRFHLSSAQWIPEKGRKRMEEMHKNQLTKDGYLIIKSDKTRTQSINLADCLDKLRCIVREACKPPPEVLPETSMMLKARKERQARERLRQKRMHSEIKNSRKAVTAHDL